MDTSLLSKPADTRNVIPMIAYTDSRPETALPLRVAVLEHDETLREKTLVPGLRRYGFKVESVHNTRGLQQALLNTDYDLCLLDSVLSDGDGISLPHWLRGQYPQMGVVIFSHYIDPDDHLRGLKEGADAYLPKPTSVDIVAATLTSVARRMQRPAISVALPASAQWQLQSDGWRLISPDGAQVTLTISERRLVRVLWEREGGLVTRDELMQTVTNGRDHTGEIDPHGLDVLLYRLRRKVQGRTGQALPLEVVRGAGYILHRQTGLLGSVPRQ